MIQTNSSCFWSETQSDNARHFPVNKIPTKIPTTFAWFSLIFRVSRNLVSIVKPSEIASVWFMPIRCLSWEILFKLATVTYKAWLSGLPAYLQCEIHNYHPSRTLRSTSALLLQQQPATISFAEIAFCAATPTVWNSLGVHTHSADMFLTFKNRLKTELFQSCYL